MPTSQTIFDITEGRNRYEPCPACKADFGMGLSVKVAKPIFKLAVECSCGFRGPEIECPDPTIPGAWEAWPVPSHQRDKQAFDAWNALPRNSENVCEN
jgi:hypothetical protein